MSNKVWCEDDTPRDLSIYDGMTKEEREAEIKRLEEEHKKKKQQPKGNYD